MTAEEWFSVFNEKYGDDFNWTIIPFTNHYFVEELKRELGDEAQNKSIYPIAKCDSKDDVLFLFDGEYRIYHLTYSDKNLEGWPRYKGYSDLSSAMEFIEKEYKRYKGISWLLLGISYRRILSSVSPGSSRSGPRNG